MTTCSAEIKLIEDAMRNTRSTRMLVRYQVILLHLKGYYNIQIADIVDKCEHSWQIRNRL